VCSFVCVSPRRCPTVSYFNSTRYSTDMYKWHDHSFFRFFLYLPFFTARSLSFLKGPACALQAPEVAARWQQAGCLPGSTAHYPVRAVPLSSHLWFGRMPVACTVDSGCCLRHPQACATGVARRPHVEMSFSNETKPCESQISLGTLAGQLPWRLNDRVPGVNGVMAVHKRNWARGGISGSVSRQMQHHFMWQYVDGHAGTRPTARPSVRCLDWDGWYGGTIFKSICHEVDVLVYAKPFGRVPSKPLPKGNFPQHRVRWWHADAHTMASVLPNGAFSLIIANSVFEHLERPFTAMTQMALLLEPGGVLFWHTPTHFPMHGVPYDFFRYTIAGARAVAMEAGLEVQYALADGGDAAVLANTLGLSSKFWTPAELVEAPDVRSTTAPRMYMSTRMIAVKAGGEHAFVPAAPDQITMERSDQYYGRLTAEVRRSQFGHRRAPRGDATREPPARQSRLATGMCPAPSSKHFVEAVRREWRAGRMPLRGDGNATVMQYLRHRFWQMTSAQLPGRRRCLHWSSDPPPGGPPSDVPEALTSLCQDVRIVSTLPPPGEVQFEILLSSGMFARSRDPWATMQQVARLLAPGGRLLWHEPFAQVDHGPTDYFRFTTSAAKSLALSAGLEVEAPGPQADGTYAAVVAATCGIPPMSRIWGSNSLTLGAGENSQRGHYLATRMIARRPQNNPQQS
jgi:ubiquinone/menaquinone biosynthesis C-methylase UbiE